MDVRLGRASTCFEVATSTFVECGCVDVPCGGCSKCVEMAARRAWRWLLDVLLRRLLDVR